MPEVTPKGLCDGSTWWKQVDHGAVLTTQGTASPGFVDQDAAYALMTTGDRFAYAALAAQSTAGIAVEDRLPVVLAQPGDRRFRHRRTSCADDERLVRQRQARMFAKQPDDMRPLGLEPRSLGLKDRNLDH